LLRRASPASQALGSQVPRRGHSAGPPGTARTSGVRPRRSSVDLVLCYLFRDFRLDRAMVLGAASRFTSRENRQTEPSATCCRSPRPGCLRFLCFVRSAYRSPSVLSGRHLGCGRHHSLGDRGSEHCRGAARTSLGRGTRRPTGTPSSVARVVRIRVRLHSRWSLRSLVVPAEARTAGAGGLTRCCS
jgi:hypothetical protein